MKLKFIFLFFFVLKSEFIIFFFRKDKAFISFKCEIIIFIIVNCVRKRESKR